VTATPHKLAVLLTPVTNDPILQTFIFVLLVLMAMSQLLVLPKELRLMIFEQLAASTVFHSPCSPNGINLDVNHFAISQTRRQFYSEASSCFCLRHRLLDCRSTQHVLDILSAMITEQLRSIRYLKFTSIPIVLHKGDDDPDRPGIGLECFVYSAQVVLQIPFPELHLETLVYLDPHHGPSD
jgi:hypothetical protein